MLGIGRQGCTMLEHCCFTESRIDSESPLELGQELAICLLSLFESSVSSPIATVAV